MAAAMALAVSNNEVVDLGCKPSEDLRITGGAAADRLKRLLKATDLKDKPVAPWYARTLAFDSCKQTCPVPAGQKLAPSAPAAAITRCTADPTVTSSVVATKPTLLVRLPPEPPFGNRAPKATRATTATPKANAKARQPNKLRKPRPAPKRVVFLSDIYEAEDALLKSLKLTGSPESRLRRILDALKAADPPKRPLPWYRSLFSASSKQTLGSRSHTPSRSFARIVPRTTQSRSYPHSTYPTASVVCSPDLVCASPSVVSRPRLLVSVLLAASPSSLIRPAGSFAHSLVI